ncbi:hypothetical protein [Nesterenkonia sp. F]|uniref:hypothetical protein n=1 Tax=Nesterenkonia sp. F TaxID=795955 RepID=UPI000255C981|nr:hypothetical protein [Nesterenkonia sp. F]
MPSSSSDDGSIRLDRPDRPGAATWATPQRLRRRLAARLRGVHDESGSSIIEFIMLAVLLMIPVVYFLIGVSTVQAATYAGVGAADQAAKIYASGGETSSGERARRAEVAARSVLQGYGIEASRASVSRSCPTGGCDAAGDVVTYDVEIRVPVPLFSRLGSWEATLASVSSTSAQVQEG